jgi:hypothetical protein
LKFEFHRSAGKRVQLVFSKKKGDRPFQTHIRLPAYIQAQVQIPRIPNTDTESTGHGYTGTNCTQRVLANHWPHPHTTAECLLYRGNKMGLILSEYGYKHL